MLANTYHAIFNLDALDFHIRRTWLIPCVAPKDALLGEASVINMKLAAGRWFKVKNHEYSDSLTITHIDPNGEDSLECHNGPDRKTESLCPCYVVHQRKGTNSEKHRSHSNLISLLGSPVFMYSSEKA
jgi:hypothetical protein